MRAVVRSRRINKSTLVLKSGAAGVVFRPVPSSHGDLRKPISEVHSISARSSRARKNMLLLVARDESIEVQSARIY